MQIKTTMKYYFNMSEWLPSINQQTTNVGEAVENGEPLCTVGGKADQCNHCGEQYGGYSKN